MQYDVVIAGAGAAGLIAARELSRAGKTVALLEARDRFGGRMHAAADPRALAPVELGPEFVHGRPEITYALLHEAGTTAIDDSSESFVFRDGTLHRSEDDPFAAASDLLAKALERDDDESVDALLARHANDERSREAAEWTRRLVSGFDAADTARASARAIAKEWGGDAAAGGAQSRPLGGYAPLVAHLARSLDPQLVEVRRGAVVTRIERNASGVEVVARELGEASTYRARRAIVTLPIGVLRAAPGSEGAVTFDPPLPETARTAIAQIAMGPVVKVVLVFSEPFWEKLNGGAYRDGAFFNGDGEFPTLWTQLPVRANTLVAWAGGPAAQRLDGLTREQKITAAMRCVARYFGDADAAARHFAAAYHHDWERDPLARGAYSYVLTGGEGSRAALRAPIDGSLWFAGEATASHGEGGTVAGALESGIRAARGITALGM